MPVYEYECLNCGHVTERTHKINVVLRNAFCLECNQWARFKRLISRSTFILKGPGWSPAGYQGEKHA